MEAKRVPQGGFVEERTVALMTIIVTVQMKEGASTVYNEENLFTLRHIHTIIRNRKLWNEYGICISERDRTDYQSHRQTQENCAYCRLLEDAGFEVMENRSHNP